METILKFANVRPDASPFTGLMREEQDILDRAVRGSLSTDRPKIKMIHEKMGIAIEDALRSSGWIDIDDWKADINACLVATGLITPKARNTMSAARLSVTTCRETRMILALEAPSDVHANTEGRRAPIPAGAEGIRNVPELIKTDDDNAFFAAATFNQFIIQEAV